MLPALGPPGRPKKQRKVGGMDERSFVAFLNLGLFDSPTVSSIALQRVKVSLDRLHLLAPSLTSKIRYSLLFGPCAHMVSHSELAGKKTSAVCAPCNVRNISEASFHEFGNNTQPPCLLDFCLRHTLSSLDSILERRSFSRFRCIGNTTQVGRTRRSRPSLKVWESNSQY
jgi:hypothetical protein